MSTATKYTPGPLRAVASTYGGGYAIKESKGHIVAECFEDIRSAFECSREEAKANATLYATAPELLEQARNMLSFIEEAVRAGILDATEVSQQFGDVRALIAKATWSAS